MRRAALALLTFLAAAPAFARANAPDWLKALARAPLPSYPAETRGVALLDEQHTMVTPDGEMVVRVRRAYKILTTEGRELGDVAVYFDSETKVKDLKAWSITASGEEYELGNRDILEASAFDGELYADNKMKVVRIPAAGPGTVIGYEYEKRERPYGLQEAWYFQQGVPVRTARFTLTLPPGWTHEERWLNATGITPKQVMDARTWELTEIPAIESEPRMPARSAIAGRLAVQLVPPAGVFSNRSHRTWNDLGRWYSGLVAQRQAPTPPLQAKARELTASATTTLDKIRALAAFAQRDIRYVAIEIGIGGVQPHMAGDIFRSRYGDCKDKVTVLGSMLRELGIESYYVLVHTDRGVVDEKFPSLYSFNHVISAIKLPNDAQVSGLQSVMNHPKLGKLLLFDPTSAATPLGLLPNYLQDTRGLLVANDGGELLPLMVHPPETNKIMRTARLKLDESGRLAGEVREVRTGWVAAAQREALAAMNATERQQYVEHRVAQHVSQVNVKDIVFENVDDTTRELVFRYTIEATAYARKTGPLMLVRPRVVGRMAEGLLDLAKRKYPYETDGPSLEIDDVEISFPAGLAADELPAPVAVANAAVTYDSKTSFEAATLKYKRQYQIRTFDVPVASLAELNKAFQQILADERNSAVFVRK